MSGCCDLKIQTIDFCQKHWICLHLKKVLLPKSLHSCDEITLSAFLKIVLGTCTATSTRYEQTRKFFFKRSQFILTVIFTMYVHLITIRARINKKKSDVVREVEWSKRLRLSAKSAPFASILKLEKPCSLRTGSFYRLPRFQTVPQLPEYSIEFDHRM